MIICSESIIVRRMSISQWILLSSYMLMSTVLVFGYGGVLVSFISAPKYLYPPIDDALDLENSGREWVTVGPRANDRTFEYFKHANSVLQYKSGPNEKR